VLSINIIEALSSFVISVIEQFGYAGVFVGMTLESIGVPLPSEIIMPFAGYVVWEGKLTLIGVAVAGTLTFNTPIDLGRPSLRINSAKYPVKYMAVFQSSG
jgi:hypothetical protein